MKWRLGISLALLLALLFASSAAAAGEDRETIWKWTDADGVVHFTNDPEGHPPDATGKAARSLFLAVRQPRPPIDVAGDPPTDALPRRDDAKPARERMETPSDGTRDETARAYDRGFENALRLAESPRPDPPAPVVQNVVHGPTIQNVVNVEAEARSERRPFRHVVFPRGLVPLGPRPGAAPSFRTEDVTPGSFRAAGPSPRGAGGGIARLRALR